MIAPAMVHLKHDRAFPTWLDWHGDLPLRYTADSADRELREIVNEIDNAIIEFFSQPKAPIMS